MRALFELFLAICLLRKGPQDVPASPVLLRLTLLSYGISGVLMRLLDADLPTALTLTVLDSALLAGLAYGALTLRHYPSRLTQTLTALLGTGTLLQLLALPLMLLLQQDVVAANAPVWLVLLWLGLFIWSIVIMAYILRHALSTSLGIGMLYSLAYVVLYWFLSGWFQPVN
ncbi:MAG: hypothetical protein U1F76_28570 [Candidatus Competibacteraceae bacterium]